MLQIYIFQDLNLVHDSSITKSGFYDYESFTGFGNIFLQNGKIQIKSINVSNTQIMCDDFYTICLYSSQSRTRFSTFFNATSGHTESMTLDYFNFKEAFELVDCNILEVQYGSVFSAHNTIVHIKNCSILRCIPSDYFVNFDSEIIIDQCYFDASDLEIYGTVNFTNNVASYFTHNLSHFSSAFCYAENPIIYLKQQKKNYTLDLDISLLFGSSANISLIKK